MDVTKFLIENISMPDEVKKEIFELSRLDKIDLDKLTKLKSAKAIEAAAENPSGTAGMGIGLGAGMAMANQMAQAMSNQIQNNNQNAQPSGQTPPPIPGAAAYYVAIAGQQAGPFNRAGLIELATKEQLTKDTLVWKSGMTDWALAGEQTDLQDIWSSTPPPLPKQD